MISISDFHKLYTDASLTERSKRDYTRLVEIRSTVESLIQEEFENTLKKNKQTINSELDYLEKINLLCASNEYESALNNKLFRNKIQEIITQIGRIFEIGNSVKTLEKLYIELKRVCDDYLKAYEKYADSINSSVEHCDISHDFSQYELNMIQEFLQTDMQTMNMFNKLIDFDLI